MPGESKAYNLTLKRKAIIKTFGLEYRETDEFQLSKLVFKSQYINNTMVLMENLFMKHIKKVVALKDVYISGFKIDHIIRELIN